MTRAPATPPEPVFTLPLPHGTCVGVEIPERLAPDLRAALHPGERAFLDTLAPGRQPSFAAGRVALRAALVTVAPDASAARRFEDTPYLPGPSGAPTLPPGALASISHKRRLAIALAAPADPNGPEAALGVDLEEQRRLRVDIGRRVLTERERVRVAARPPAERDLHLIEHFSLKEALYKAVNGFGLGPVSFQTVEVSRISDDGAVGFSVPLLLEQHLVMTGWFGSPIDGYVVASVRAVRATR